MEGQVKDRRDEDRHKKGHGRTMKEDKENTEGVVRRKLTQEELDE